MQSHYSPANLPSRLAQERAEHVAQIQRLLSCSATHAQKIFQNHAERTLGLWRAGLQTQQGLVQSLQDGSLVADSSQYLIDAAQRSALTVDVLRERDVPVNADRAWETRIGAALRKRQCLKKQVRTGTQMTRRWYGVMRR